MIITICWSFLGRVLGRTESVYWSSADAHFLSAVLAEIECVTQKKGLRDHVGMHNCIFPTRCVGCGNISYEKLMANVSSLRLISTLVWGGRERHFCCALEHAESEFPSNLQPFHETNCFTAVNLSRLWFDSFARILNFVAGDKASFIFIAYRNYFLCCSRIESNARKKF